jgi:hypothetical protein
MVHRSDSSLLVHKKWKHALLYAQFESPAFDEAAYIARALVGTRNSDPHSTWEADQHCLGEDVALYHPTKQTGHTRRSHSHTPYNALNRLT